MRRLTRQAIWLVLPALLSALAPLADGQPAGSKSQDVNALFAQADDLIAKGKFPEAKRILSRALKAAEAAAGPDSPLVATACLRLGRLHHNLAEYSQAEPQLARCLKIRDKLGKDSLDTAEALNYLGVTLVEMGRFARAEPLYLRCQRVREQKLGDKHPDVAQILHNRGWLYVKLSKHSKAEPLFERALKIREEKRGPDHPDTAATLNALGLLYKDHGRYDKAELNILRSLNIRESQSKRDELGIAVSMNNLGLVYAALGQHAKAEKLLLRSLEIRKAKRGPRHPDVAQGLNNLASLYVNTRRHAEAEKLYREALAIYEVTHGKDHLAYGTALTNLGDAYYYLGQYDKAASRLQRGLEIREKALGKDHPLVAASLRTLAFLHLERGQADKAAQLHRRVLTIREAKFGKGHPHVAASLNELAVTYQILGQDAKAGRSLDLAQRVQRHHLTRVLPAMAEREQLGMLRHVALTTYPIALSYGVKVGDDADRAAQSASWVLNGKAIGGEAMNSSTLLARDSNDPNLGTVAKGLLEVREQMAKLTFSPAREGEDEARAKQMKDLTFKEQQLSRIYRQGAGLGAGMDEWVELDDVRKALPADGVFIDVARYKKFDPKATRDERWKELHYAAWVTPKSGRVRVLDLGPASAIDDAVKAVREELNRAPQLIVKKGEAFAEEVLRERLGVLSKLVMTPILPHVGEAKRWLISPDGNLWLVPWEILLLADGRYAVEGHALTYLSSGRDLLSAPAPKGKAGQPVVVANPDFDLDRTQAKAKGPTGERLRAAPPPKLGAVKALPGTLVEAKAIEKNLVAYAGQKSQQLLGQDALEARVKALKNPRVLVLATHGFFLKGDEDRPTSLPLREERMVLPPGAENPLLRCGLLLAGYNKSARATTGDDGVLTGLEVASLDLRGCEMVVLSACETGLGDIQNGEGVAGLRQAFCLAGAESVVSSLWKVPDLASATLISEFFAELAKGKGRAEAMQLARRKVIESRRDDAATAHPFFWAAFTLTGR